MVKNRDILQPIRRKAARRSPLRDYNAIDKKLYKNPKTGTMYHITELDAFKMKMGLNPNATSIREARSQPISLEEVKKPTKAMKVLFGENKDD